MDKNEKNSVLQILKKLSVIQTLEKKQPVLQTFGGYYGKDYGPHRRL
ncbi:hypothetical protein [Eubacterium sp. An11]|nr:hypothetical protein [Eubacterium sp. An11]